MTVTEPRELHSRNPLLFFAGMLCLTRGLAYTFASQVKDDLPSGLAKLSAFLPIWVYGTVWLAAAASLAWMGFKPKARAYSLMVFSALPAFIWAGAYAVGWFGVHDRSWIAIFLYWTVSGLIFWAAMTKPQGGWRG